MTVRRHEARPFASRAAPTRDGRVRSPRGAAFKRRFGLHATSNHLLSWHAVCLAIGYQSGEIKSTWELFDQSGLALSNDDEIAGRGVIFVAAERRRLRGLGIVLGDDMEGDYSTLAQVRDPDGNLLTLVRRRRGPFRRRDLSGRSRDSSCRPTRPIIYL